MALSVSGFGARLLRTRWLVRAPILLYRAGLGRLLGRRILMLEHRGRRSGRRRYVCLEVVERPAPDRLLVVSGFGEQAQWYQNLLAHPRCVVSSGRIGWAPARARAMTAAEATVSLNRYRLRRPRDWRVLKSVIERAVGHPVTELPMIELRLLLGG